MSAPQHIRSLECHRPGYPRQSRPLTGFYIWCGLALYPWLSYSTFRFTRCCDHRSFIARSTPPTRCFVALPFRRILRTSLFGSSSISKSVGLSPSGLDRESLNMEVARNTRAAKRSRETTALGDGRRTPCEDRARARARRQHFNVEELDDEAEEEEEQEGRQRHFNVEELDDEAEEEEEQEEGRQRQQRGHDPRPSMPNLAVHFAELTNAVLRRVEDKRTNDKRFDKFIQSSKRKIIRDLKRAYKELYKFYNDPSKRMPDWLSNNPPAQSFWTNKIDGRLLRKKGHIEQEVRAFVEELGFICLNLHTSNLSFNGRVYFNLRLDVATVPTPEARNRVENRLLTLEMALQ